MRFRFCGGLEPPDWLLAELSLLVPLARGCDLAALCEEIGDAIASEQGVERAAAVFTDRGDAKAVVAVLRFVLRHAAKFDVSSADLAVELLQLGLEAAAVDDIARVFAAKHAQIRAQLDRESFEFPHIQKIDWRVHSASDGPDGSKQMVDVSFELDQPVLECAVRPAAAVQSKAAGEASGSASLLELTMDKDKFLALYEDLLQAQQLLQSIQI